VYLFVSQKEKNNWFSICAPKKKNTQIKNGHVVVCIHVLGQRNHLLCKTNTQQTVVKVNNLRIEEKQSYVYLRICVLGQRNHSPSLLVTL
jgi:hypothetical protein